MPGRVRDISSGRDLTIFRVQVILAFDRHRALLTLGTVSGTRRVTTFWSLFFATFFFFMQARKPSNRLMVFFPFYGGKFRAAPRYPAPHHSTIIEPFAGAAGYATRYWHHDVILHDVDPILAGLWDYLIHVSSAEILRLPVGIEHVDQVRGPQEARWLVGFWMNHGCDHPPTMPSSRMKAGLRPHSHWGETVRYRLAMQVSKIRHWEIHREGYDRIPNRQATWFVDPPYNNQAGRHYRFHDVDYSHLASWCQDRSGQIIVCENAGASWLPFRRMGLIHVGGLSRRSGREWSDEVVWTQDAA